MDCAILCDARPDVRLGRVMRTRETFQRKWTVQFCVLSMIRCAAATVAAAAATTVPWPSAKLKFKDAHARDV